MPVDPPRVPAGESERGAPATGGLRFRLRPPRACAWGSVPLLLLAFAGAVHGEATHGALLGEVPFQRVVVLDAHTAIKLLLVAHGVVARALDAKALAVGGGNGPAGAGLGPVAGEPGAEFPFARIPCPIFEVVPFLAVGHFVPAGHLQCRPSQRPLAFASAREGGFEFRTFAFRHHGLDRFRIGIDDVAGTGPIPKHGFEELHLGRRSGLGGRRGHGVRAVKAVTAGEERER